MYKKIFLAGLALFVLLSSAKNSFCKTVTLPVTGIPKLVPKTADISVEWNEGFFGRKSSFSYDHSIARIAAIFADNAYVDVLEEKENPLYRSYKILGFADDNIFFKYDVDYNDSTYGINQCAFSIASKTIDSAKGKKTLVFLIIRGTPLGSEEWISNLNINNSQKDSATIHEGFSVASKQILFYLDEFLSQHHINSKDAFLLVSGHSRGASVANLCSVFLADSKKFLPQNIYAYTFAAPNVTSQDTGELNQYKFIWNIVNAEDVVPTMPPKRNHWDFQKYGNTRVLINAWNTDLEKYLNEYLPRMNSYFRKFFDRDFSPFKTGSFIPIIITKFLTTSYPEPEQFYSGFLHPHDTAAKFIKEKVFTGETSHEQVESVISVIDDAINSDNKLKKKIVWSCINMHTMESYLCWLLALNEDEIFSTMESQVIRLQGHQNCSLVNEKDEVILRIENAKVIFSSIKAPAVAFSKSINTTFIGFPKNANYKILVSSNSFIKSPFQVELEYYSPEGGYLGCSKKKEFYTDTKLVYEFCRATNADEKFPLTVRQFYDKDALEVQDKYELRPDKKFSFHPELSWDMDNRITIGGRIGSQQIFGTVLTDFNFYRFGDYLSLWMGVGTQQKIYARFYVDAEFFTKFVYVTSPQDSSRKTNLVPTVRFSTVFRPRSSKQIFLAGLFEFNIEDFNDDAFDFSVKRNTIPSFPLGNSVKIYPTIQAGIRF